MASVFICPECGGGIPTRRGIRRHLLAHGWEPQAAYQRSLELDRRRPPTSWRCGRCRRRFSEARGLIRHARVAGHSRGSPQPA